MITDDDLDKLADEFKEWRIADQMNCNSCPESKLALKEDGSAETVMDPDSETCKECMDDMRTTGAHINAGMLAAYFDDAMYCIGRIATTELIDEVRHGNGFRTTNGFQYTPFARKNQIFFLFFHVLIQ